VRGPGCVSLFFFGKRISCKYTGKQDGTCNANDNMDGRKEGGVYNECNHRKTGGAQIFYPVLKEPTELPAAAPR